MCTKSRNSLKLMFEPADMDLRHKALILIRKTNNPVIRGCFKLRFTASLHMYQCQAAGV